MEMLRVALLTNFESDFGKDGYENVMKMRVLREVAGEVKSAPACSVRHLENVTYHPASNKRGARLSGTHNVIEKYDNIAQQVVQIFQLDDSVMDFGIMCVKKRKTITIEVSPDFKLHVGNGFLRLQLMKDDFFPYQRQWESLSRWSTINKKTKGFLWDRPLNYSLTYSKSYDAEKHAELNASQATAVMKFCRLERGVMLLEGPPGTGKSTTIVACIQSMHETHSILIAGQSNKCIQCIAENLLKKNIQFILVGSFDKTPEHLQMFHLRNNAKKWISCSVVLSTLSGCTNEKLHKRKWDVLIVDEAGLATEPATFQAFALNPRKVLLVGDIHQLKPICKLSPQELVESKCNVSMMERLMSEGVDAPRLTVNYRCHQDIYELANKECYDSEVETDTTRTILADEGLNFSHETFFDVPVADKSAAEEKKDGFCNSSETLLVLQILSILKEKPGINISTDVQVVAMYAGHVTQLTDALSKCPELHRHQVPVSTADSMQGSEKSIIVACFTRTDGVGFLNDNGRINVLSTRARECVIYIGDLNNLLTQSRRDSLLRKMMERAQQKHLVKSLNDCIFLPVAKQLLDSVGYQSADYFTSVPLPSELLSTLKQLSDNCISSTIDLQWVRKAVVELCGEQEVSDEDVKLVAPFYAQKFDRFVANIQFLSAAFNRPAQLLLLAQAYQRHPKLCDSEDGLGRALGIYETIANNQIEGVSDRQQSYARALTIAPKLKLDGIDISHEVAVDAMSVKELYLRAGSSVQDREIDLLAIVDLANQDDFVMHAGNFGEVYGAYCRLGEMRYADGNISDAQDFFEQAVALEGRCGLLTSSWALEKLAAIKCTQMVDLVEAKQLAMKALYRNAANINAYRVYAHVTSLMEAA